MPSRLTVFRPSTELSVVVELLSMSEISHTESGIPSSVNICKLPVKSNIARCLPQDEMKTFAAENGSECLPGKVRTPLNSELEQTNSISDVFVRCQTEREYNPSLVGPARTRIESSLWKQQQDIPNG